MGIRFLCPNGHRLNVKAFLAGKRGVCPHCGAKMMIPLESQLAPRTKEERAAGRAQSRAQEAADAGGTVKATKPAVAVATPELPDPIDESPDMVWYVRPKAGGQYGPARGEVMKRWIGEGRVAADSLVWREGWDDWQPAKEVLPQLGSAERESDAPAAKEVKPVAAPAAAAPAKKTPPAKRTSPAAKTVKQQAPKPKEPADPEPVPAAATTVKRRRRKKTNSKTLTAVIVLSLVSIGLLVALVIVLMQQGSA